MLKVFFYCLRVCFCRRNSNITYLSKAIRLEGMVVGLVWRQRGVEGELWASFLLIQRVGSLVSLFGWRELLLFQASSLRPTSNPLCSSYYIFCVKKKPLLKIVTMEKSRLQLLSFGYFTLYFLSLFPILCSVVFPFLSFYSFHDFSFLPVSVLKSSLCTTDMRKILY